MQGSFGFGPKGKEEKGPSADTCVKVPGSDGKERKILRCCLGEGNNGLWFPEVNDCHNAVADCITKNGLVPPEAPGGRVGLNRPDNPGDSWV